MKIPWLTVALVACAKAQYFSEGWTPGQEVSSEAPNIAEEITNVFEAQQPRRTPGNKPHVPPEVPRKKKSISDILDFTWVLSSPPVSSIFSLVGINITERLAKAKESPWDPRIPLITDDNYEAIIVNETLTEDEEKTRTWVLIVSGDYQQAGVSPVIDEIFDKSFDETITLNDLPDLRWGRLDYLNVTYLTTKWGVWQAPMLVILKDRGQSLRFFRPQYMPLRDGGMREFLKKEYYLRSMPWNSSFAPGGSREFILHYFGYALMKLYTVMVTVPRWILYLFSGTIASGLVQFLHRAPPARPRAQTQAPPQGDQPPPASTASQSNTEKTTSGSQEGGATKRKKAKK
ncbi:hypothetical protein V5O48_004522 [Marasmius crinis-equi]|uniref:Thioredoxin-like fold domain-containing protein n=1 Tax=Marasmius crinis-equi TaxID=585013 RepID=A0ABR3FQ10_9AGAR